MLLTIVAAMFATSACKNNNEPDGSTDKPTDGVIELDATDKNTWHYYNLEGKLVGSANDTEIPTWDARKDWDFAIQRYAIRTKVGIYTFDSDFDYASIKEVPNNAEFIADAYRNIGMPSKRQKVSNAVVAIMSGMPPVWTPAAHYAVLSADESKAAKINFLSYQKVVEVDGKPQSVSGYVSFKIEIIPALDYTVVPGEDDPEVTNISTDDTIWKYYTINGIYVGEATDEDNDAWKARNDWDFAFKMSNVRTNSGTSTATGKGGVSKFADGVTFEDVTEVAADAVWVVDEMVASPMGGDPVSKSPESLIKLDMSEMPPVFDFNQNVFAIRSADGTKTSKIIFTGYSKEDGNRITSFNIAGL